jgi:hypothetical protein
MPRKLSQSQKTQRERFIAAAKAADMDEDEKRWEARLRAVAKPPVKAAKKGK